MGLPDLAHRQFKGGNALFRPVSLLLQSPEPDAAALRSGGATAAPPRTLPPLKAATSSNPLRRGALEPDGPLRSRRPAAARAGVDAAGLRGDPTTMASVRLGNGRLIRFPHSIPGLPWFG